MSTEIPGELVAESKMSPCSSFAALRLVNLILKVGITGFWLFNILRKKFDIIDCKQGLKYASRDKKFFNSSTE